MKPAYSIPAAPIEHCYEIKNSKFIARVEYVEDRSSAMAVLEQAKHDYPDARHHCWAYLLGDPAQPVSAAFSGDGEPSGTAGKPILNVLNHRGVGDIIVVVIRYFGGVKLGAGGLVRAYSAATQRAIEMLSTRQLVPKVELSLRGQYAHESELRRLVDNLKGEIVDTDYSTDLRLVMSVPCAAEAEVQEYVASRKGMTLVKP